jgi:hypothetical protein
MPRLSKRKRFLRDYKVAIDARLSSAALLKRCGLKRPCVSTLSDMAHINRYKVLSAQRYLFREGAYRKRTFKGLRDCLYDKNEMTEDEFLVQFRVTRTAFFEVLAEIDGDHVFCSGKSRIRQAPIAYQLLVFLVFLGTEGDGSSNVKVKNLLRPLGRGTVDLFKKRIAQAIINLETAVVFWPEEDERREIAQRFQKDYVFPNCVAVGDGTLMGLAFKPSVAGEDYNARKGGYSINTLIVNDDQTRIRYYHIGNCGTDHDFRVMKRTRLYRKAREFFCHNQYMLTDSAIEPRWFIVPAFKKLPNQEMPDDQVRFNDFLKVPRVTSENTIGRLKGRFPQLKCLRPRITGKKSMRRIICFVRAAIVLHNLLIEHPPPEDWVDEDFLELDDDDELNSQLPDDAPETERRQQVFRYILMETGHR